MPAFAFLTIRLLAIFLIVEGLLSFSSVVFMWPMTDPDGNRLLDTSMLLVPLFPPIAGVLIWFSASRLSQLALPATLQAADIISIDTAAWTRLVVVVFGLYLVVVALPNLAAVAARAAEMSGAVPETSVMALMRNDSSISMQVTHSAAQLLLGLILALGPIAATKLVALLSKSGASGGAT